MTEWECQCLMHGQNDNKVPTFGYDANNDAVAAIAEGYGGTISQHARRTGIFDIACYP